MAIQTVNSQIVDKTLQHAIHLEQFKKGEVSKIVKMLYREINPGLYAQISKLGDHPSASRLKSILKATQALISVAVNNAEKDVRESLAGLAINEAEWLQGIVKDVVPFNVSFTMPNVNTLKALATSKPFEGKLMKQWFAKLGADTQDKLKRQLNIGVTAGESVPDLVKRVRGTAANSFKDGVMAVSGRNAAAIVRTAVNHVSTAAREATMEENSNVIKGVQMHATLDGRTTLFCKGIDGKVFKPGEGPRPPFHWNCRTTPIPVLKSWDELGIKGLKEAPASTRASMNGQVPDTETYDSWLKKQSKEFQDETLGPGKAAIFREGKLKLDQFTDNSGKELTLTELKALSAAPASKPQTIIESKKSVPAPKPIPKEIKEQTEGINRNLKAAVDKISQDGSSLGIDAQSHLKHTADMADKYIHTSAYGGIQSPATQTWYKSLNSAEQSFLDDAATAKAKSMQSFMDYDATKETQRDWRKDDKEYESKYGNRWERFEKKLTREQRYALDNYVGSGYVSQNAYLRTGQGTQEVAERTRQVRKIFAQAEPLVEDTIVHRNGGVSEAFLAEVAKAGKGGQIEFKGFVSTATIPQANFMRHDGITLIIKMPKGAKTLVGMNRGEREMLLNHASKFRVVSGPTPKTYRFGSEYRVNVIKLEWIGDG